MLTSLLDLTQSKPNSGFKEIKLSTISGTARHNPHLSMVQQFILKCLGNYFMAVVLEIICCKIPLTNAKFVFRPYAEFCHFSCILTYFLSKLTFRYVHFPHSQRRSVFEQAPCARLDCFTSLLLHVKPSTWIRNFAQL